MPTLDEVKSDYLALCDALGVEQRLGKHKCPFHPDKTPSLNIRIGRDGYVHWKCFAGCGQGTIVQALALRDKVDEAAVLRRFGYNTPETPILKPRQVRYHPREHKEPKPIPRRLDTVIKAITEQNYALLHDGTVDDLKVVVDTMKRRGVNARTMYEYDATYDNLVTFQSIRGNSSRDYVYPRTWFFVIRDALGIPKAVKVHKEFPADGIKSGWAPCGQWNVEENRPVHGFATFYPAPETFDPDPLDECVDNWEPEWKDKFDALVRKGRDDFFAEDDIRNEARRTYRTKSEKVLFLFPGELKALAALSCGLQATSVTSGEAIRWTTGLIHRLRDRKVCIVYDDDTAGVAFNTATVDALKHVCLDLRSITLGRVGDKKVDSNDYARDNGSLRLKARLLELHAAAPDIHVPQFSLCDHRNDLKEAVRAAIHGPAGIRLFRSIVGAGKSRSVIDIINDSPSLRFVLFVADHKLARQYEAAIPGSRRFVSPRKADDEQLVRDDDGMACGCPSIKIIKALGDRRIPYAQRCCVSCPLKAGCPVVIQKESDDRVIILQHAHLAMLDGTTQKLIEGRVRIIDESCVTKLKWVSAWSADQMEGFRSAVDEFATTEDGLAVTNDIYRIRQILNQVRDCPMGESVSPHGSLTNPDRLVRAWGRFLVDHNCNFNLMPDILSILNNGMWVRRGLKAGKEAYWTVRCAIPDDDQPTLILDATADESAYRCVFGPSRTITVWPEGRPPKPEADIVQFIDGMYPLATLWNEGDDSVEPSPKPALKSIISEVNDIVKVKNLSPIDIGLVASKRLIPTLRDAFPEVPDNQFMWYGNMRGLNDMEKCKLVVCIGIQCPSDIDLAWMAIALNGLDLPPEVLVGTHERKLVRMEGCDTLDAFDAPTRDLRDPRIETAWNLSVVSELIQGVGRARPYEVRPERQTVLVYTSTPMNVRVSRVMTRKQYRTELGIIDPKVLDLEGRITCAMNTLRRNGPVDYEALAKELNVKPETMGTNPNYRNAIHKVCAELGLKRTGGYRGCPVKFD